MTMIQNSAPSKLVFKNTLDFSSALRLSIGFASCDPSLHKMASLTELKRWTWFDPRPDQQISSSSPADLLNPGNSYEKTALKRLSFWIWMAGAPGGRAAKGWNPRIIQPSARSDIVRIWCGFHYDGSPASFLQHALDFVGFASFAQPYSSTKPKERK